MNLNSLGKQMTNIYTKLSAERKKLQELGNIPEWISTPSYQILKEKYLVGNDTLKSRFHEISNAAASHLPHPLDLKYKKIFFDLMWKGWLSCSTPILASMGRSTFVGCPVSCSGQDIGDSVESFYENQLESAILTQKGFGTSVYLGDIRPRGSQISNSTGLASGVLPVLKMFTQVAQDISQGSTRRGAIACYLPIDHDDFDEIINYVNKNPDGINLGWCISDNFISRLNSGDLEANRRYVQTLKLKLSSGKGYFHFSDKVNGANPQWYKDKNVDIKASNLCDEITLPSSDTESFTCVLSAMNLAKYDEWMDTTAIYDSTIFLHCVALEFLKVSEGIKGLEKAREFTKNHMALGLGVMGFHTLLQSKHLKFGEFQANLLNVVIFQRLEKYTKIASIKLAEIFGECPMTKGYGVANAHLTAISPTLSTALIMGGVSNGIEPIYSNAYIQNTAAGKITRINPYVLEIAKEKGIDSESLAKELINNGGSTQKLDWLTDHQKEVTKTAFEINQEDILRLASVRQRYITQGQSINLFFPADESEEEISRIHKLAFTDKYIKGLYYIRSTTGIKAKDREVACEACAS